MSFEVGWELLLFLPNSVLFAIYLHQHSDILIFDVSMCSITSQSIIEENIEVEISDNVGVFRSTLNTLRVLLRVNLCWRIFLFEIYVNM